MNRILIVDDDEDILESLEALLQVTYQVVTARNGREALRILLADSAFDAVVLDLMMPVMDGQTLLEQLAAHGVTVPVILVSARDDVGVVAAAMNTADFLLKPVDIRILRDKIARVVGGPSGPEGSGNVSGSAAAGKYAGESDDGDGTSGTEQCMWVLDADWLWGSSASAAGWAVYCWKGTPPASTAW